MMFIKDAIAIIEEKEKVHNQYKLAKLLGVSQSTISNYKNGKTYPTLDVAALVYKRYGLRCEPFTEEALKREIEKHGGRYEALRASDRD
jgi:transcriptional regulator with XRE-family HTH domain